MKDVHHIINILKDPRQTIAQTPEFVSLMLNQTPPFDRAKLRFFACEKMMFGHKNPKHHQDTMLDVAKACVRHETKTKNAKSPKHLLEDALGVFLKHASQERIFIYARILGFYTSQTDPTPKHTWLAEHILDNVQKDQWSYKRKGHLSIYFFGTSACAPYVVNHLCETHPRFIPLMEEFFQLMSYDTSLHDYPFLAARKSKQELEQVVSSRQTSKPRMM